MTGVGRWLAGRWKAIAALVAGGAAMEVASAVWPGNEVAAAAAALLTALAVHQAPANRPAP